MSIPKITGQQARELLDDFNNPRTPIGGVPVRGLLETLAWLYGREPDHVGNDQSTARRGPMVVEVDWARQVHLWPINGTPFDLHITADEAVDLARALLAAAEEARDA